MNLSRIRLPRPWLLALAGLGLIVYLARPSLTQQPGGPEIPKKDVGKTSYDQIAPVIHLCTTLPITLYMAVGGHVGQSGETLTNQWNASKRPSALS